jgi:hypothetical protein
MARRFRISPTKDCGFVIKEKFFFGLFHTGPLKYYSFFHELTYINYVTDYTIFKTVEEAKEAIDLTLVKDLIRKKDKEDLRQKQKDFMKNNSPVDYP